MRHKYSILVLFLFFLPTISSAQNFKLSQPNIIDNQSTWLKQKSEANKNKGEERKESIDIYYPKVDSISKSATAGVYWRLHTDFLPQEYVFIRNEDGIEDSINLKYRNAIVNFLWLNDSFNEDSITYTYNSIAPVKIDSIYFTYAHVNRSGMPNYIRTRLVNVNINNGIPILTDEPVWENVMTTDTSLTAPNNDPLYLFNDVMVVPVNEEVTFDLPFAVVVDFYGGDKTMDEFYLLCTYNNTCGSNTSTLAEHSKFYPNSFFNISTQFGSQNIEGLFPLSPNGILGIDANGNGIVGESEFCEAFYVQNWHIGITVSFEAALTGNIIASRDTICKNDTLILEAVGKFGSPPYTYLWQSADGTSLSTDQKVELLPQNSNTYMLQITDAANKTFSVQKEIIVNSLSLTMPDDANIPCGTKYSIEPAVNASDNNLTYNWINGDTELEINVFPGNYSLTVSDGYCTVTDSINVNIETDLVADFEATIGYGGSVNFNNLSINSTNYFWDFGDGQTSIEENPEHIFTKEGTYVVILSVLNGNCSINKYKTISINDFTVSLNEAELADNFVVINPNPSATGDFWVSINQKENNRALINYTIFNLSGKTLINKQLENDQNRFKINLKHLPNNIYFIKIKDGNSIIIKKLLLLQ